MEFITEDKRNNAGYRLMLKYLEHDAFRNNMNERSRFRLVLVESGACVIRIGGIGELHTAPALLCLSDTDTVEVEEHAPINALSLYFHPGIINCRFDFDNIRKPEGFSPTEEQDRYLLMPFISRSEKYSGVLDLESGYLGRITWLFHAIRDELENQPDIAWPCRSRSLLLELLILVGRLRQDDCYVKAEAQNDRLEEILAYLRTHYREKITVNHLARLFNMNRTSLNHYFLKATNSPVIEYLIKLRIQLASAFMRDTMLNVAEVMDRVGFSNHTHFWRMFRKHTGLSPQEYRRKYCWIK